MVPHNSKSDLLLVLCTYLVLRLSLETFGLFLGELGALPTEELKAMPLGKDIFLLLILLFWSRWELLGANDWSSSILFD